MAKFIARYIKLITVLYITVSAIAIVVLSKFKVLEPVYTWLIFLVATVGFFIAIFCIQSRYQKRIDAEFLNTCKPQRYVEFYTLCYKGDPKNVINQINYSAVLTWDRKNMQMAKLLMEQIKVDKIPRKFANVKFVFYNNLASVYVVLNELEKAENAYKNAENCYNQIENDLVKAQMKSKLATLECSIAILRMDSEAAISCLSQIKAETLLEKVSYALMLAKICILKNEMEEAKKQLNFVIENADNISFGQEAKELLSNV